MYIVDDPTLALITRFVGTPPNDAEQLDSEFFYRQIAAIQAYVDQFPEREREQRALQWIEANARNYRQAWQKRVAIDTLTHTLCADCPLACQREGKPCVIHSRWLALLQRYAANELSSHDYVAHSLELLNAHKAQLKVSQRHVGLPESSFSDSQETRLN